MSAEQQRLASLLSTVTRERDEATATIAAGLAELTALDPEDTDHENLVYGIRGTVAWMREAEDLMSQAIVRAETAEASIVQLSADVERLSGRLAQAEGLLQRIHRIHGYSEIHEHFETHGVAGLLSDAEGVRTDGT